jgi:hypothetical protein
MLFAYEYCETCVIAGESKITQRNAERFRARVELAAAASNHIVIDLRRTHLDSWAFLLILELNDRLGPRLVLLAPDFLRKGFAEVKPAANLAIYSSMDEALSREPLIPGDV